MGVRKILLLLVSSLLFVSQFARIFTSKTHIANQSVLLVTAHPDDESMFFGPTIRHVLSQNNELHFLVLSNGGADGLGAVREQEMRAVAPLFGAKTENVEVVNDARLQDGDDWDTEVVAEHVTRALAQISPATVITFDEDGVSGHKNHKAVHEGALLAATNANNAGLSLLTLYSVPLWRKYLFTLDSIVSRVVTLPQTQYTIISGSVDYAAARRALTTAHKSQMVWFRWLWAFFSRYMVVNDLGEVDLGHGLRSKQPVTVEPRKVRGSNIQTAVKPPRPTFTKSSSVSKPVTRQRPAQSIVHAEL